MSILTSIKKMLGLTEEDTSFDVDIIMAINSALMALTQIGAGPETGFIITDKTAKWSDFIGDRIDLESIKSYVYLKTRLMFDPPSSSYVLEAYERHLSELGWRINVQIENTTPDPVVVEEGGTA